MKKVRVAVLGYGHLGKWHCQKVEACLDKADFVGIVEKFPAGREAAAKAYPNVKVVEDIKEIINDIDGAFVVTPTSTHFGLVSYLLQNGKHVFCEKPVCSNDDEAKKLEEIARGKNVLVQVGHSERFHEAWETLRSKFQSLPTPYTVRINRYAAFKGRATDVDVVQDLGIHDLDLLMYLFQERPLEIRALGQKIRTDKWDHASIYVQMEKGCEASIVIGRNHVKEVRELEVVSQDGTVLIDLFTNKIYEACSSNYEDGTFVKETPYNKRDHLLLEHRAFYTSILEGKGPAVSLADGIAAVHLVDCTLNALKGHAAVKVQLHA